MGCSWALLGLNGLGGRSIYTSLLIFISYIYHRNLWQQQIILKVLTLNLFFSPPFYLVTSVSYRGFFFLILFHHLFIFVLGRIVGILFLLYPIFHFVFPKSISYVFRSDHYWYRFFNPCDDQYHANPEILHD